MCRVLSYLGKPISLLELLYEPDNSFIKQSYNPKYMSHLLNLAGYGLVAWDPHSHNSSIPYIYKTPRLPFYDENLRNLASKIMPHCLLTHIRGVSYNEKQIVSEQNVHPFMFPNAHFALAHNGSLFNFNEMKYDLLEYIKPEYQTYIHGTTDSEWIYAVFISQLPDVKTQDANVVMDAILETLKILKRVREKHHIAINSPVNLFISNGHFVAATRFVFDYGWQPPQAHDLAHLTYHSLWYTFGEAYGFYENEYRMSGKTSRSIIIASEPLTADTTTWIEVPEYTLLMVYLENDDVKIISKDITL